MRIKPATSNNIRNNATRLRSCRRSLSGSVFYPAAILIATIYAAVPCHAQHGERPAIGGNADVPAESPDPGSLHIENDDRAAFETSAYVTWTTDYVYRGVSLTGSDPAWQGGADIAHRSGLFAGVWTSAVDYAPPAGPNTEHNVFAGYSRDFGMSWRGAVQFTRFDFRGGQVGPDNAFNQWQIDVQYNKASSLRLYQTDNTYGTGYSSTAIEMQHIVPIADNWLLSGLFGQWDLKNLSGYHYNYIELGGSWSVQRFGVALHYHHADSRGRKLYPDAARPGWLASATYRLF